MIEVAALVGLTITVVALLTWDTFRRALAHQSVRAAAQPDAELQEQLTREVARLDARCDDLDTRARVGEAERQSIVAGIGVKDVYSARRR